MKDLIDFLNELPPSDREAFAIRCGTTERYMRKAASVGQRLRESVCINVERESGGRVRCEALRPDVDWAYLRATNCPAPTVEAA